VEWGAWMRDEQQEHTANGAISAYAFLSDCQTAALVSSAGSIDWYCPGRFDAPAVFARLLDPAGGHWSIRPQAAAVAERDYLSDTLVLRTVFRTAQGAVCLTDALAFAPGARGHQIGARSPQVILRRVEGLAGHVELELACAPRFEYGLTAPHVAVDSAGATLTAGVLELRLLTRCPLEVTDASVTARFTLRAGETLDFALVSRQVYGEGEPPPWAEDVGAALEDTIAGWRSWAAEHQGYDGLYQTEVRRSALVLQGLTYQPSGAIVAAATTSLPEVPGGEANWDYRFAWLRDLSLTLRALWVAACPTEVTRYIDWLVQALGSGLDPEQDVQIMFGLAGERDLAEHTLPHLRGFADSAPIRVGNDAWRQPQLDVLGEVLDVIYLFRDMLDLADGRLRRLAIALANQAAARWPEPDAGMWEARDRKRHYLSSKLLCWVALDRAVKLAPRLGAEAQAAGWSAARAAVRAAIVDEGWNEAVGAYTGAFGSDRLDASVLLMPLVEFVPATDPRMRATIETIARELAPHGPVQRWAGDPNGFLLCTYWLVECLARAGEWARARALFEQTTAHASALGLMAEMVDPATGVQWGNTPQAFSHIGLINAAWCLTQTRPGADADNDKHS
jgi:GH15 family glucan-1,4-alpha-glucosidase